MVNQQGSPFYAEDAGAMQRSHKRIVSTFPISRVYQAHIPTYAAGYWFEPEALMPHGGGTKPRTRAKTGGGIKRCTIQNYMCLFIIAIAANKIFNIRFKQSLSLTDCAVFDSGDLELCFGSAQMALEEIEARAARILQDGKFPILLGGEHSVCSLAK